MIPRRWIKLAMVTLCLYIMLMSKGKYVKMLNNNKYIITFDQGWAQIRFYFRYWFLLFNTDIHIYFSNSAGHGWLLHDGWPIHIYSASCKVLFQTCLLHPYPYLQLLFYSNSNLLLFLSLLDPFYFCKYICTLAHDFFLVVVNHLSHPLPFYTSPSLSVLFLIS